MTQIPALVISGTCDSVEAADLLVRYRIDGTTDWSQASIPVNTGDLTITSVLPSTTYNVEVAYRSVRGVQSDWLALDDVTTDLLQVDTPDIVDGAVTEFDQQVQVSGFGGGGPILIAYEGAGHNVYTLLDEYTFTFNGVGTAQIQWSGRMRWQANSAKKVWLFLTIDTAPSWTGTVDDDYLIIADYEGNQNVLTTTAVMSVNLTGLSVGSHTLGVYGKCDSNANQPLLAEGATTRYQLGKK